MSSRVGVLFVLGLRKDMVIMNSNLVSRDELKLDANVSLKMYGGG